MVWESKDHPGMSKRAGWDAWNNFCPPTQPWGGLKVKNERFLLVSELEKPHCGLQLPHEANYRKS